MSERAEEFLEEDYFHLTLDCKRELPYIVSAMQEYADQEVERYKQENIRNLLLDFADYNESDKVSTTTDEVVDNYLDEVKTNKR